MRQQSSPFIRSLVSFIGIDYELLKRSGEDNIAKFYVSGVFVIGIALISFCAVYYGFDLMYHKWYAELLLSTFFSLTFLTIYLLLIQTFSKETLPAAYKKGVRKASNITRVCFVLLIGFLIAQPVKIYLLRDQLEQDVAGYKEKLYNGFVASSYKLYEPDLAKLHKSQAQYEKMAYDNYSAALISQNNQRMATLLNHIDADNAVARTKIDGSDFFLKRIEFAGHYWQAYLTTMLVILIFGVPVILIYSISDNSKYYAEKRAADHHLVERSYEDFKRIYRAIFREKYGLDIHYHEAFDDPPYNWIRKPDPDHGDNDDFFNAYGLR